MNGNVFNSIEMSFRGLWADVMLFLPEVVLALLVVIVGWILANIAKSLISRIIKMFHIDDMLDRAGFDTLTKKAGYKFRPAHFIGSLVKWFIIIVFLVTALDILNLNEVTAFFSGQVLGYLPRVIVAALILLGSMVVAQVVGASVEAGARASGFKSADVLGMFTRYAIIVFAVLAALSQLQIAETLVQTLFAGLVFGLSLAFGLAFGLGGRETAARYLSKMEHEVTGKHHNH